MLFINEEKDKKIKIDDETDMGFHWETAKTGQEIELNEIVGKANGLKPVVGDDSNEAKEVSEEVEEDSDKTEDDKPDAEEVSKKKTIKVLKKGKKNKK